MTKTRVVLLVSTASLALWAGPAAIVALMPIALIYGCVTAMFGLLGILLPQRIQPLQPLDAFVGFAAPLVALPIAAFWVWTELLRRAPTALDATAVSIPLVLGVVGLALLVVWLRYRR